MQDPWPPPPRSRPWRAPAGLLAALLLLATLFAAGCRHQPGTQSTPSPARVPVLASYPLTVAPKLHLLGGLSPSAAYVVETSEGLVLIDTGLDPTADALRSQMTSLSLDWRKVRAILLTHVHGDHSGGAEAMRAATGAKVYAGQGDAAALRTGRPREAFFSMFDMPQVTLHPTHVDVAVTDGQVIIVGDAQFRVLASPGHTPGSVCYLLERCDQRALFSGDVIMSLLGHPLSPDPFEHPLGTYAAYLAPRYHGDARAFLSTLRRLRALPAPPLVLPGHPRMDPVPQSPVMTQPRWEALLDGGIREMVRLQARYTKDGADFLDGAPKELLPHLYYLGDFKSRPVYCFLTRTGLVLVDAPGGPNLSSFVRTRLKALHAHAVAVRAVLLTSGDAAATAGLADVLRSSRPLVVASPAAWQAVKRACPTGTQFLSPAALSRRSLLPVTPIALPGRGVGAVAYLVRWAGKTVLVSGSIPVKPTPATVQDLAADMAHGRGDGTTYCASLQRLGQLRPDLWLPAIPGNSQNANLYDDQWKDILAQNRHLFR